jgi:hypothetical protein
VEEYKNPLPHLDSSEYYHHLYPVHRFHYEWYGTLQAWQIDDGLGRIVQGLYKVIVVHDMVQNAS